MKSHSNKKILLFLLKNEIATSIEILQEKKNEINYVKVTVAK